MRHRTRSMRSKMCICMIVSSAVLASVLLSGCAAVDHFGPRATDYNAQTSLSKTDAILTNIVRAAYSQPLQFTDVTTVTGQGSLAATLGATLPLSGKPTSAPQVFSLAPTSTASGTSTFNVVNLNTQEFYYGIQAPISTQLVASYLNAGFPASVLLPLVISDIEVEQGDRRAVFHNDPSSPETFFAFYSALQQLRRNGLSTQTKKPQYVGPPLSAEQASDAKVIAALIATSSSDVSLREYGHGFYRLAKRADAFDLCFDPVRRANYYPDRGIDLQIGPTRSGAYTFALLRDAKGPIAALKLTVKPDKICNYQAQSKVAADGSDDSGEKSSSTRSIGTNFRIRLRSTEGVIKFLGEMVREQEGIGGNGRNALGVPISKEESFFLFRLQNFDAPDPVNQAAFETKHYQVFDDPSGVHDGSSLVVAFITDLLALQSSAKNIPASNLVTVLSP